MKRTHYLQSPLNRHNSAQEREFWSQGRQAVQPRPLRGCYMRHGWTLRTRPCPHSMYGQARRTTFKTSWGRRLCGTRHVGRGAPEQGSRRNEATWPEELTPRKPLSPARAHRQRGPFSASTGNEAELTPGHFSLVSTRWHELLKMGMWSM